LHSRFSLRWHILPSQKLETRAIISALLLNQNEQIRIKSEHHLYKLLCSIPEDAVPAQTGQVYGLQEDMILSRSHSVAYLCAAWLLRRSANIPINYPAAS